MDSGYCSEKNSKYLAKKKINGFVATGKEKHDEQREPCKRGPVPQRATRVELGRKLESRLGSDLRRTKTDRGPVFRQIKQARGFRQFLLRGGVDLDQVSTTAVPGDEAVDRGLLDKRTGEPEIPCQGVTHMCIRGSQPRLAVREPKLSPAFYVGQSEGLDVANQVIEFAYAA